MYTARLLLFTGTVVVVVVVVVLVVVIVVVVVVMSQLGGAYIRRQMPRRDEEFQQSVIFQEHVGDASGVDRMTPGRSADMHGNDVARLDLCQLA